jgi:hypothetical protein
MSPEEAQPAPRRRGRPPGSKNATTTRRKREGGSQLVARLNAMVADLIKENRKLRRQVVKLSDRRASTTGGTVDRDLRTLSRRVERALSGGGARKKRTASANGRRKGSTRRRRKAA